MKIGDILELLQFNIINIPRIRGVENLKYLRSNFVKTSFSALNAIRSQWMVSSFYLIQCASSISWSKKRRGKISSLNVRIGYLKEKWIEVFQNFRIPDLEKIINFYPKESLKQSILKTRDIAQKFIRSILDQIRCYHTAVVSSFPKMYSLNKIRALHPESPFLKKIEVPFLKILKINLGASAKKIAKVSIAVLCCGLVFGSSYWAFYSPILKQPQEKPLSLSVKPKKAESAFTRNFSQVQQVPITASSSCIESVYVLLYLGIGALAGSIISAAILLKSQEQNEDTLSSAPLVDLIDQRPSSKRGGMLSVCKKRKPRSSGDLKRYTVTSGRRRGPAFKSSRSVSQIYPSLSDFQPDESSDSSRENDVHTENLVSSTSSQSICSTTNNIPPLKKMHLRKGAWGKLTRAIAGVTEEEADSVRFKELQRKESKYIERLKKLTQTQPSSYFGRIKNCREKELTEAALLDVQKALRITSKCRTS